MAWTCSGPLAWPSAWTLSNVAAGVMLLICRPYKVGDYVDAGGHSGTVKRLAMFFTELATSNNIQIIVPNAQIWGNAIQNFSANDTRRVVIDIGISYDDDIETAIEHIRNVINNDSRILSDPAPYVAFSNEDCYLPNTIGGYILMLLETESH